MLNGEPAEVVVEWVCVRSKRLIELARSLMDDISNQYNELVSDTGGYQFDKYAMMDCMYLSGTNTRIHTCTATSLRFHIIRHLFWIWLNASAMLFYPTSGTSVARLGYRLKYCFHTFACTLQPAFTRFKLQRLSSQHNWFGFVFGK